jgi:CubicO group peptidase (beta-lactamase class C family)
MRRALVVVAIVLAGCASGGGEVTHAVNDLMRDYEGEVPGASVLVIHDGRTVVRRSYGLADLDAKTPVTPSTNYRLASVTKQFTAAAIVALVDEGKVGLGDPIETWLPSLPVKGITVQQLLTHTSGVIDYEDLMPAETTVQILDAGVLRLLESENRTYFAPGTAYQYSNSGYALLALIVERASGKTFATFLRDRIFAPLGMRNTLAFENGISTVANRAYGHSFIDGAWKRTDQSTTSAVLGDGGVYSSIDDLAKWDAALYDRRFARAFVPRTATRDPGVDYGFGWRISAYRNERMVWHSGETRGFRNVILRFPDRRLTVIVLTNRNDPEPYETALKIAALFL